MFLKSRNIIVILSLVIASCAPRVPYVYNPNFPVEARYASWGRHIVTNQTVVDTRGRPLFEVYYPGALQGPYPIITWGNGTGELPDTYHELGQHLASWGFVFIAPYDENVGDGSSMLAGAEFLVAENSNPNSIFYGQLDILHIGSAGTSQGANGALNVHTNHQQGHLITTVAVHALPSSDFAHIAQDHDTSRVRVPLLILGGTEDEFFSPLKVNQAAARRVPRGVPVFLAMSIGGDHIEMAQDGGRMRGYLTAWMAYQLQGDAYAASAFTGTSPEIIRHPLWRDIYASN
ncbi:MAG: alpha/beta hydrolase [Deinococcota bacterium]